MNNILKFTFQIILCLTLFIFFASLIYFVYILKDLPRPEKFTEINIAQATQIYDQTGKVLLYEIVGEEKRTIVPFSNIPDFLKNLIIITEDRNFFQHKGIDPKAIIRAFLYDLKLKKRAQGASTITQQLIRSYFLTQKKTIERKTKEIILSMEIERRYSKDQILEWYLNLIPFGSNIYGVEEAARSFFNKPVSEISVAEAAILASLIKSPSYLSPYGQHIDQLLQRKDYVLQKMVEHKYLNQEQIDQIKKQEIKFQSKIIPIKAPHFVMYVKSFLEEKYGRNFLNRKGLKVYTTLDYEIQKTAEDILEKHLKKLEKYNIYNGGLVTINPKTGEILAMIGSKDYFGEPYPKNCIPGKNCKFDPKVNVVLSLRQPGSAFKPFVYAKAFLDGFTPQTLLWDVKTEFNLNCSPDATQITGKHNSKCYHPKNYSGKFSGLVDLKSALAQSLNLPSVKVLYLTGVNKVLNFVQDFGITTLNQKERYGLSLVLGGGEVKLLEMTSAYAVFAANGVKMPLQFIKKIEDSQGNIIETNKTFKNRIIPSWTAQEINAILSNNALRAPVFGLDSPLYLKNYQTAVKTGTTQNRKDAWIIGYTPSVVTGIWLGNNNNSPFYKKSSFSLAGPIWKEFMEIVLKKFPKENFISPKPRLSENPILNGEMPKEDNHSILHYLNPNDPQHLYWEKGISNFLNSQPNP